MLTSDQVLVTIGTPCSLSAVGSTATYHARVAQDANFIAYAAFDAGLIEFGESSQLATLPPMRWREGGQAVTVAEIEAKHGAHLRSQLGIRSIADRFLPAVELETDIAACLPHDLEDGGLRQLAGLTYQQIRDSALKDMYGLFDDDPRLGPPLQAQLFMYAGIGSLAALPRPLRELLPDPYRFRVAGATAFSGFDSLHQWIPPGTAPGESRKLRDRFLMRLAGSLSSHGPALISTMLSPSYSLSRSLKHPELLDSLKSENLGYLRVPQTPLTTVGACASSSIAFTEIAPQMLLNYPGFQRPQIALWTAADAALRPDFGLLDAFGSGALMTMGKLDAMNAGRAPEDRRSVADALAPFDIDANGTVVGHGGSGLLITTLDFALRNFLDITSIIAGWGQSNEAGGKAHFAGVGFGGENALIHAFDLAYQGHGYTVADFDYLIAHATGTRTNSKTDLTTANNARIAAAARQGMKGPLPTMFVGTPKAIGDGHSMGETGLKGVSQALQHLLGKIAVGVPTLRHPDPELGPAAESFVLQSKPVPGNLDGGVVCATQGFGGYNGAIVFRGAHPKSISRYAGDAKVLAAYLERWPQLRAERELRERSWRLRRASTLDLAQTHCWEGA